MLIPDTEAPVPKTKRKASFKAALQNFTTTLGSDLFTPASAIKHNLARDGSISRPSILNGESAADLPIKRLSLEGHIPLQQLENGDSLALLLHYLPVALSGRACKKASPLWSGSDALVQDL